VQILRTNASPAPLKGPHFLLSSPHLRPTERYRPLRMPKLFLEDKKPLR
jgi:hypothetical protein